MRVKQKLEEARRLKFSQDKSKVVVKNEQSE